MGRVPVELGVGVWQYQTPLWQTNCLLALVGGEAVLCDPSYTRDELESLRDEVEQQGVSAVHVLVTHADYDHVCGLGSFPGATAVAVEGTASRVEDGSAGEALAAAGREWGIAWRLEGVRIDRTVDVGEVQLGAVPVDVVDAPSHGREGAAFVLPDQGILFAGDHLSPITIPLLAGSLQAAVAANEALLDALDRHELRWIVPGHGRVLSPAEAREIGQADLAYLQSLQRSAREAVERRLAPGDAVLHVYAVEPPRPDTDDFAVYGIRAGNVRLALEEAGR